MTTGERALDLALRQQWPRRVLVAHCREPCVGAVTAHLPAGMRGHAEQAMRAAGDLPDVSGAKHVLADLAATWQPTHPGAAARPRAEIDFTPLTRALGIYGVLAQRLRTAAPAAYGLDRCLSGGAGSDGPAMVGSRGLGGEAVSGWFPAAG